MSGGGAGVVTDPSGPAYPPDWEADVVASDGGTVHLRPIRPDDGERIRALHGRLSERTRYLRYFGAYPRIPDKDLHRFIHVDHTDRVALVAELGTALIAVARYERIEETADAEVAFVVEDAHQGRGLGSVLLEHLAAAARERRLRRFVADVLAENPRMVRIFLDAGYSASRTYESGVVRLTFPIEPTDTSVAVAFEREQRSEARSIERLLTPRSVAVIGASADPGKVGHIVLAHLLGYEFAGPVFPVNAEARHVGGVPAYASVLDIPDDVDLAVVAVPAAAVADVVGQCARKRVRALVVVSAGFGERDPAGREAERALVAAARANGMRVVGPNCLGVINSAPAVRLNASLAPVAPAAGSVGFFCQSGALGIATLAAATERGLGLSTFVSAGNRADVSGNDLLQYWARDPATDVVLLWLESFGNPRKFARLARQLARRKPVAVVRSGRQTGASAGAAGQVPSVPEASVDALFAEIGVVQVDTVADLLDVAQLLAYQPLPAGRRVGVVGNSSALGTLVVDASLGSGLQVASGHPVDLGPDPTPERFATALRAVVADDGVDAIVVVFAPALITSGAEFAHVIRAVTDDCGKPVASTFLAAEGVPQQLRRLGPTGAPVRGSVPSYPSPERAVIALAKAVRYAEWRGRAVGAVPQLPDVDTATAKDVVAAVLADDPAGRELTRGEVGRLLAAYGIRLWPAQVVDTAQGAVAAARAVGYPVAVKSTSASLRHRPDLGGVRLDLGDDEAIVAAYHGIPGDVPEVEVQAMAPNGVAIVVGVIDDPTFGALVSFGVGGVATELLGDRAYAPTPVSDLDAARLVRAPRAAPLLSGYRGAEPVDLGAAEDLVARVGRLAEDLPELLSLTLDPVLVAGSGLSVLAATARIGQATARADTGPRRLR
jgi:acyl-CoA synthetase (NDP forming)/GNAT superfamily N-acetyltransferase